MTPIDRVKQALRDYRGIDVLISAKQMEIDELDDTYSQRTTASYKPQLGSHGGGVSDKVAEIAVKKTVREKQLQAEIARHERFRKLMFTALEKLTPRQRELIDLRYWKGCSQERAAELIWRNQDEQGVSSKTIERWEAETLEQLAQWLGYSDFDPAWCHDCKAKCEGGGC